MPTGTVSKVGFFHSLRGRLLILFLAVALIPLMVTGIILTRQFYQVHVSQIEREFSNMATFQAHAMETWLADRIRDVTLLAQQPEIQSMEPDMFIPKVLGFRESLRIYTDLIVLTPDGDALFDTSDSGLNLAERPYFQAAMNGQAVASDILFSRLDGLPIVVFAAPVYGVSGEIVGVVAAVMRATHITELVAMTWQGDTGDAYLVNSDGVFITNSRFTDELLEAGVVEQFTAGELQIDTAATQAMLAGGGSTLQTESFREYDVLAAHYYMGDQGWGLIIEQSRSEVFSELFRFQMLIVGLFGLTALLVTGVAIFSVRWFTNPITRLSEAAREIAGGNLDFEFKVAGQSELADLGNAFNDMTGRLKNLLAEAQESRLYLEETIANYMGFVEQVALGNLRERIALTTESEDDDLARLGRSLNSMVDSLAEMTLQIREMATSVSSAVAEILAATTQQIASATEQDASVTQTVATVEEIIVTVKQTAERATGVADASQQSVQVSREGQESVTASVEGMQAVRDRVEDIATTILALSERTQQIGEIISAVNDIADQSKLLALNASIEAARAGEEGRGFNVVAQEVRQLAEESRAATARVAAILNEIQQATNTAVMVTEEGSKGADAGVDLVGQAGLAIRDLSQTIDDAAQAATQIAASTQQQTSGMEQLSAAMVSIKQATVQAAASTRQAESSAQTLVELVRQMDDAVSRYQL